MIKKQIILEAIADKGALNTIEIFELVGEQTKQSRAQVACYLAFLRNRDQVIEGGISGARYMLTKKGISYLQTEDAGQAQDHEPATGETCDGHDCDDPTHYHDEPDDDAGIDAEFHRFITEPPARDTIPELLAMDAISRALDAVAHSPSAMHRVLDWVDAKFRNTPRG